MIAIAALALHPEGFEVGAADALDRGDRIGADALVRLRMPALQPRVGGAEPARCGDARRAHLGAVIHHVALHLGAAGDAFGPGGVISLDYVVALEHAREFYDAMRALRRSRQRNGAFGWSLSRDIADPRVWTERYQFPAWGDYLRMRDRHTAADLEAQAAVDLQIVPGSPRVVRRKLERPFGSVRWRADSPDLHQDASVILPP